MATAGRVLLLCLALDRAVATASGQNNPLNLPAPLDAAKPGTVVLHGGGPLSDEIFEKFIELAGGREARIVLVPSGTYVRGVDLDHVEFDESEDAFLARITRRYGSWVDLKAKGRVASFQFLYTDNQQDADRSEFVAPLRDATGVWMPAAYQGKLTWRFAPNAPEKTSLFQEALRDVVARGGVVGGRGGGMAALPELMIMGDTGQENGPAQARVYHGLTLFSGAIVDQNFDARGGRLERFTGLLKATAFLDRAVTWPAAGRSMIGLAVEPRTALLLRGSTVAAIGQGRGHVFVKSNGDRTITWRVLAPADGKVDLVASSEQPDNGRAGERPTGREEKWENPFGMPWPPTGSRPGTVVLHGGGRNQDLIRVYPSLSGMARPHLVHCPAADADFRPRSGKAPAVLDAEIAAYFSPWTDLLNEGRLAGLQFLTTSDRADADRAGFVSPLARAHAVWFSGGSQAELGELFVGRDGATQFQQELWGVVRRGGVVGGSSAGAAVMPEIMIIAGVPQNGTPADAVIARGLGVLKNVIVEQHFQGAGRGGRIERFTRLLLDNDRLRRAVGKDGPKAEDLIGLAVEEQTALVLQANRLRVFGRQKAHVFLKSADQKTITWHALEPGDTAFMRHGRGGPVLEMDEWRIR